MLHIYMVVETQFVQVVCNWSLTADLTLALLPWELLERMNRTVSFVFVPRLYD